MNLPELDVDDFAAFMEALHGKDRTPFAWQTRLAHEVAERGDWPHVLDAPTGAGKTATIDIALFHLALEADRGHERRAPLRIAFVVDRRVVVDAAFDRAVKIRDRLKCALDEDEGSVLTRVAQRLAHLSGEQTPLLVRPLRGGMPRENDWARTPSQPTVLCSTVDQIGSRLLFRGYGVSDSMKPIHAGLVGSDCLILLDEAHLSEPFRQTLESIRTFRSGRWVEHEPGPWSFVTLSATPGDQDEDRFSLSAEERREPRLAPRLSAAKPAKLTRVSARTSQPAAHAQAIVEQAWELAESGEDNDKPRIIALIVNRVALARRCFRQLEQLRREKDDSSEIVLFIGRSRECDRSALVEKYKSQISSDRGRSEKTLFVVATQCIEAGADFDFDALVTQIAPLDALRQRFGRLNRIGRPIPARAAIVACTDEISSRADDHLYGKRAKRTWQWLEQQIQDDVVDFGVNALDARLVRQDTRHLITERKYAPVLMPAYMELWAQTNPTPSADPEPALFLHGAPEAADVQIVWRSDIGKFDAGDDAQRDRLISILSLMPPRSAEAVGVPIRTARAWLSGEMVPSAPDVEGVIAEEDPTSSCREIPAFRWHGSESDDTGPIRPRDLRPGDVIVVSALSGGCDEFGWNPGSERPVTDLALHAAWPYAKRRFALPVHRAHLESELTRQELRDPSLRSKPVDPIWRDIKSVIDQARNGLSAVDAARTMARVDNLPNAWKTALDAISRTDATPRAKAISAVFAYEKEGSFGAGGMIFVADHGVSLTPALGDGDNPDEAITEGDDAGSFMPHKIELAEHASDVQSKTIAFARRAGLPDRIASDLAIAAYLHDEGKRDNRFQLYLRRGDRLSLEIDPRILAKSDLPYTDSRTEARVRQTCELPERWRHEADSVVRALNHERLAHANDKNLVLWLIGTHHGHGRPHFPHIDPTRRGPQNLDFQIDGWDWPQLFTALLRHYGPWELARFEAILRLADHRASQEEAQRRDLQ